MREDVLKIESQPVFDKLIYDDIAEKLSADESAYLEVVGNIFENPELLGEEVQIWWQKE